jgi:acyl phosphate:glycerol-3-phosphate acyltransferase
MIDAVTWILCIIISYLIGAFPVAYLVVKLRYGKDIRRYGTGQSGGSNVFRSFSKKLGITVAIYDILKGAVIIAIAKLLSLDTAHQVVIGMAAILGHNWPVFLKFNAGRGVATSIGVGLMLFPLALPGFLLVAVVALVIGSTPLPVLAGMASFSVFSWAMGKPTVLTLGLLGLFIVMVVRRLTAPIPERSKHIKIGQLLLNRFFFDRDIRDAKTWMEYKPSDDIEQTKSKVP